MERIVELFTDTVMESPHAFSAGTRTYYLYPLTLGKLMLIQRLMDGMGVDEHTLATAPMAEVIKIVNTHRNACLRLIVYATATGREQCFDVKHINDAVQQLSVELTDEDIVTLMVYILTCDKVEEIKKHYGIDKENEDMSRASKVKSQGGAISFGGKTILGTLIDNACERYGWSAEYVVWGISYTLLRLLLADRVNTLYLSDDERKKLPQAVVHRDESIIKASKETMEQIKSMDWR